MLAKVAFSHIDGVCRFSDHSCWHRFTHGTEGRLPLREFPTRPIVPAAVSVALLFASASGAVAQDLLTAEQVSRIDSVVAAQMAETGAPGLSVAVGRGGVLIWAKGYGSAGLEHDVPATAETLYRTASISKWMSATAAMRLVEAGTLDLSAPVQRYCPVFPEKRWPVTSRHLLTHRAGIRHYWGSNDEPKDTPQERARLRDRSQAEQIGQYTRYTNVITPVAQFKDDSLLFEPGTRFHYSSHGFRLLGCVLRGAAEQPYADLMRELVFGPAGMTRTLTDDHYAVIEHRAAGYWRRGGGPLLRAPYRDVTENLPAGGHLSTAPDLVRFAMAFDGGSLVSEKSITEMTAYPEFPNGQPLATDAEGYYGYGVNVILSHKGYRLLLHSGGQSGTATLLVLVPEEDLAVAAMTNLQGGPAQEVAIEALEIVLGIR